MSQHRVSRPCQHASRIRREIFPRKSGRRTPPVGNPPQVICGQTRQDWLALHASFPLRRGRTISPLTGGRCCSTGGPHHDPRTTTHCQCGSSIRYVQFSTHELDKTPSSDRLSYSRLRSILDDLPRSSLLQGGYWSPWV